MKKIKLSTIIFIILIGLISLTIGLLANGYYQSIEYKVRNPIVTMEVEGFGTMKLELYPEIAPNTVKNFIKLINEGYYNGLTFHRTIPGFMIQGGDKEGTGSGQPDFTIPGEMLANKFTNNLNHARGVLSMARSDYSQASSALATEGYNSAATQFFITTKETPTLNGLYTAFGKIISGFEVIDAIENVEVITRDANATEGLDKPVNPPVIKSVTVDTFGVNYGEPIRLEPFDYNSWLLQQYGGGLTAE